MDNLQNCQQCYRVAEVEVTLHNMTQKLCSVCFRKLHYQQRKNYTLLPLTTTAKLPSGKYTLASEKGYGQQSRICSSCHRSFKPEGTEIYCEKCSDLAVIE